MLDADISGDIRAALRGAREQGHSLRLRGLNSKKFLGYPDEHDSKILDLSYHRGIIDYQPAELVVTSRAGTSLAELEANLANFKQHIACEIPRVSNLGTIGGAVAVGWSGPATPFRGRLRDAILGIKFINCEGKTMNFGGQVIKNVAGFDVGKLVCGSYGTLGVIAEISLKTSPMPVQQHTLCLESEQDAGIELMNKVAAEESSLSGACWHEGFVFLRFDNLSGGDLAVLKKIGGEQINREQASAFWQMLRDWNRKLVDKKDHEIWALTCKSTTPDLKLPGQTIIDHCGALRWYQPRATLEKQLFLKRMRELGVRAHLIQIGAGGHWHFLDIPPELIKLHRRVKQAFDPQNILNPGILGPELNP